MGFLSFHNTHPLRRSDGMVAQGQDALARDMPPPPGDCYLRTETAYTHRFASLPSQSDSRSPKMPSSTTQNRNMNRATTSQQRHPRTATIHRALTVIAPHPRSPHAADRRLLQPHATTKPPIGPSAPCRRTTLKPALHCRKSPISAGCRPASRARPRGSRALFGRIRSRKCQPEICGFGQLLARRNRIRARRLRPCRRQIRQLPPPRPAKRTGIRHGLVQLGIRTLAGTHGSEAETNSSEIPRPASAEDRYRNDTYNRLRHPLHRTSVRRGARTGDDKTIAAEDPKNTTPDTSGHDTQAHETTPEQKRQTLSRIVADGQGPLRRIRSLRVGPRSQMAAEHYAEGAATMEKFPSGNIALVAPVSRHSPIWDWPTLNLGDRDKSLKYFLWHDR